MQIAPSEDSLLQESGYLIKAKIGAVFNLLGEEIA
jgi:hypothetical protein